MKKLYAVEVWVEETQMVCVAADTSEDAEAIAESCAEMNNDTSWESLASPILDPRDIPDGWEHMHPIEGSCTCAEWFEEGPVPPDPRQMKLPGTEEV